MASVMKSAVPTKASADPATWGYPTWAEGIDPESNQASMTASTRRATGSEAGGGPGSAARHSGQAEVTSSTAGRWGSTDPTSRPQSSESSASEATQVAWPSGHFQMGSGVPQ